MVFYASGTVKKDEPSLEPEAFISLGFRCCFWAGTGVRSKATRRHSQKPVGRCLQKWIGRWANWIHSRVKATCKGQGWCFVSAWGRKDALAALPDLVNSPWSEAKVCPCLLQTSLPIEEHTRAHAWLYYVFTGEYYYKNTRNIELFLDTEGRDRWTWSNKSSNCVFHQDTK